MNIACIEGGGTKFVVAIINENLEIQDRQIIDTTNPTETMGAVVSYLNNHQFEAIGLGTFGPIDPNVNSDMYGYITTTPKKGWTNYNIVGELKKHFDVEIAFDTDVNAAALGELHYGAAKGLNSCLYLTVGTGIGGGVVVEGNTVNGLLHPELGHIRVSRLTNDELKSTCKYHSNCLEGLASGPAINKRANKPAYELDVSDPIWDIEAYYLAQAIANFILTVSPEKIILGGGVMKQKQLFSKIREIVRSELNGYINVEQLERDDYIVYPKLADDAGIIGCYALVAKLLNK